MKALAAGPWRRAAVSIGLLLLCACATAGAPVQAVPQYERIEDGLLVRADGVRKVRLLVMSDRIIRVTKGISLDLMVDEASDDLSVPDSLMVVAQPARDVPFDVAETGDRVTLSTAHVKAQVSLRTGAVR